MSSKCLLFRKKFSSALFLFRDFQNISQIESFVLWSLSDFYYLSTAIASIVVTDAAIARWEMKVEILQKTRPNIQFLERKVIKSSVVSNHGATKLSFSLTLFPSGGSLALTLRAFKTLLVCGGADSTCTILTLFTSQTKTLIRFYGGGGPVWDQLTFIFS